MKGVDQLNGNTAAGGERTVDDQQREQIAVSASSPSFQLIDSSNKTEAVASVIEVTPVSSAGSGFSHQVDLIAGMSNKYSALFDIQDSARSAMRSLAAVVQNFAGSSEVLGAVASGDAATCSFAYMIVRGLTFRTALQRFPTAWKYGDWYDKLDALSTLFRTFGGTVSSGLGTAKSIGALAGWTALAIPAAAASILFFTIWSIKAIVGLGRLLTAYTQMHLAFEKEGMSDADKVRSLADYLEQVDLALEHENDQLRGSDYVALKEQIEKLPEGAERTALEEKLEELKNEAPEREAFLQERTLSRMIMRYGSGGVKRIQEYRYFKEHLDKFSAQQEEITDHLIAGRLSPEKYDEMRKALAEKENAFVRTAIEWFNEVKSALGGGMVLQAVLLGACVLGVAAGILGLMTIHYWLPVVLGIAILASVLWIVYDAGSWEAQNEVTQSQKQWVREILSEYIDQEHFIHEKNVTAFAQYFFERADLETVNKKSKPRHQIKWTRRQLKERLLKDPQLDQLIDSEFIDYLRRHREKVLEEEDLVFLKQHIDEMILSLGKDATQKEAVRRQMRTIDFIEKGLLQNPQQERISAMLQNRSFKLARIAEEFDAFVESYSRQLLPVPA